MDWNGDGITDILAGGFEADVLYFEGTKKGLYKEGVRLKMDNGKPFEHMRTKNHYGRVLTKTENKGNQGATICVIDWDDDGDLDIISGWVRGGLFISLNIGTAKKPVISHKFVRIEAGGKPLPPTIFNGQAQQVDWDGDGKKDLLFTSKWRLKHTTSKVFWCKNSVKKGIPVYEAPQQLLLSGRPVQYHDSKMGFKREFGGGLSAYAVDWDGDGDLDLIVGDSVITHHLKKKLTGKEFADVKKLVEEYHEVGDPLKLLCYEVDVDNYLPLKHRRVRAKIALRKHFERDYPRSLQSDGRIWFFERKNKNEK